MKNYSIVRVGNEYVVQAGEARILKVASRRRAAKLVTDAAELLGQLPVYPPARTYHSRVKARLPLIQPKFLDDRA